MRVRAIFGWSWFLILCVIYSLMLAAYDFLLRHATGGPSHEGVLIHPVAIGVVVLVAFIGCYFLLARFLHARGLDPAGFWRGGLLVLLSLPVVWVMTDARPIEHDYSMDDLVSLNPEVLKSYDTLMLFQKGAGITVDTNILASCVGKILTPECTNAVVYSNEIYRAWECMARERAIIEKLDSFPGIADLTPQVHRDANMPILSFFKIRNVGRANAAYARLKTAEGHPEEAARQLAGLHRVTRKGFACATILVHKMIWCAMERLNMETASAILHDQHCTPETAQILREAFPPIPPEEVAMRRVFIGEYVGDKGIFEELTPGNFLDAFYLPDLDTRKISTEFRKTSSRVAYYLTFRKNHTLRDLRKQFDLVIEGSNKWPPDVSNAEALASTYRCHPDIRNMGGWLIASICTPSFIKAFQQIVETKILSDLLAIGIGDRLNQPVILDDPYSGGPYGRDKRTGRPFSVGPDKKPYTDDDIVLGTMPKWMR